MSTVPRSGYTEQPRVLTLGSGGQQGVLKVAPDVGHCSGIKREQPKDARRPPLSGRIRSTRDPGLKPWAVLYSRFAAHSDSLSETIGAARRQNPVAFSQLLSGPKPKRLILSPVAAGSWQLRLMKVIKPPLPSEDKRWKIVDAKMRRLGYAGHALIETLHTVQESFGYLDGSALTFVAKALRVPPSRVYGVATFYNFFSLKPQGAHTCVVCLGTACYVKGADKVLAAIEQYSGIKSGETTPGQELSLLTARCIGACAIGPAVVYDGMVAGHRTPENAVEKLKGAISHGA